MQCGPTVNFKTGMNQPTIESFDALPRPSILHTTPRGYSRGPPRTPFDARHFTTQARKLMLDVQCDTSRRTRDHTSRYEMRCFPCKTARKPVSKPRQREWPSWATGARGDPYRAPL